MRQFYKAVLACTHNQCLEQNISSFVFNEIFIFSNDNAYLCWHSTFWKETKENINMCKSIFKLDWWEIHSTTSPTILILGTHYLNYRLEPVLSTEPNLQMYSFLIYMSWSGKKKLVLAKGWSYLIRQNWSIHTYSAIVYIIRNSSPNQKSMNFDWTRQFQLCLHLLYAHAHRSRDNSDYLDCLPFWWAESADLHIKTHYDIGSICRFILYKYQIKTLFKDNG